ncbi:shikimate dehydrogenase [Rothia nasimurium]|uniref:shikimate dehydrogenase n=1 Tax=Rothia nasimurium TaxID=85336 RepID=UPI003B9EB9F2
MSTPDQSYLVGLIGSGITASLTPPLHEFAADLAGMRYLYRPLDIDRLGPSARSAPALSVGQILNWGFDLGYNAFNITYPYKQAVLQELDDVSAEAQRLGAVNTVVLQDGRTVGYNTDVTGYRQALTTGLSPSATDLTRVTQLGVGGAGSATADALLSLGVQHLALFDTDYERAASKAQHLSGLFPHACIQAVQEAELAASVSASIGLVNATPIGMHHHPGSPLPLDYLHPGLWVSDVIYLPQNTPLIEQARALGCRVLPGGLMAVGQAIDAFELITGHRPDATTMLAHFEQLLANQQGDSPSPK